VPSPKVLTACLGRCLGHLSVPIGASVLLIAWFYLLWNTTAGAVFPQIRFRTTATIAGILQEAGPVLSLNAVLRGAYQQWISKSIGQLSPVLKPAIRLKGWIYYDLLGMASALDEAEALQSPDWKS
jgi:hypothetical protein